MKGYICRTCGVNCDPADLVGGVCLDCMEEEKQRRIRSSSVTKMLNSQSYQMRLELEAMKSARNA